MKEREIDCQLFKDWIGTWQVDEYKAKKIEVMEYLGISLSRFNNLRGGKVKFTITEQELINKFAGKENFKLTQN